MYWVCWRRHGREVSRDPGRASPVALHALLVPASLPREDAGLSGPGLLNVDRAAGWHLPLPAQSRWQEVGQRALPAPLAGFLSSLPWSPHRTGFLLFGGQFCLYPDSKLFLAWGSTSGLLAWGRGPECAHCPGWATHGIAPRCAGLSGLGRYARPSPSGHLSLGAWLGARLVGLLRAPLISRSRTGGEAPSEWRRGRAGPRAELGGCSSPESRALAPCLGDRGGVDLHAGRGEGGARR